MASTNHRGTTTGLPGEFLLVDDLVYSGQAFERCRQLLGRSTGVTCTALFGFDRPDRRGAVETAAGARLPYTMAMSLLAGKIQIHASKGGAAHGC